MTWRFPATTCSGRFGALTACVAALTIAGCSSTDLAIPGPTGRTVSTTNSTRQPKPAGLTRHQIALTTRIARHEIAKWGSHIRIAVAQLHPGVVHQSNTGHTCNSGTLLRVT